MNPILRNVLAVLAGATACIVLNGFLLGMMMQLIPPPDGFDPNVMSTYSLLQTKHLPSPYCGACGSFAHWRVHCVAHRG